MKRDLSNLLPKELSAKVMDADEPEVYFEAKNYDITFYNELSYSTSGTGFTLYEDVTKGSQGETASLRTSNMELINYVRNSFLAEPKPIIRVVAANHVVLWMSAGNLPF